MIWQSKPLIGRPLLIALSLVLLFLGIHPAGAQSGDDTFAAAARLKQAHVIRSYEQCMKTGKSDSQCRNELEQLHPREIAALSRLAHLSGTVSEKRLTEAFTSCYSPNRNYEQLIGCWEGAADKLEAEQTPETKVETTAVGKINPDQLEQNLVEQLRCSQQPDPLFAFLALEKLGKIKASEMVGIDSMSCFRIDGGVDINGMHFDSICGYDANEQDQKLYPQFLWRGPGTSPSQFISLGSSADFKSVANWYIDTFQSTRLLSQSIISEHTSFGDKTEVKCSDWFRN
ncbi:MAG: hypothetical protein ACOH2H_18070 [Cypionkella sp.]